MRNDVLPPRRYLALRRSGIHGRGVFAREPIPAGTRIIEYTGERITEEIADARYPEDPSTPHHTFLFAIDGGVVIDAAYRGNLARWINHSCDPNCDAVVEGNRVFIESLRDIAPGEELRYDYNFILPERHTPAMKRRYPCICGAPNCRGTILAKKR
jgi:SET domain-containing protein